MAVSKREEQDVASDRVAAVFVDVDSAGEGLVIGLYVQSSLSSVQRVLLDEIYVVYSCYLYTQSINTVIILF